MIFEGEWTKQLREARLYLITGSGLIAVCGSLCTRSLACHPQATNPQRVQELLEPYRTNCRCFWWISHVRTVRVWLVAWRVSAQLKSVVLFVFCESEFMETDLLINSGRCERSALMTDQLFLPSALQSLCFFVFLESMRHGRCTQDQL